MAQSTNQKPKGDATDFMKLQSDLDKAKSDRQKNDAAENNSDENVTKTDVSQKKTGGGKQISPGT
jgi:hypothetical protein